ncbi:MULTISPECIES: iron-containing alcohol dehydrogenase [unclassified Thermotoga]|uniref:iron-containing alcohol dehydrogenase n=1 Tax=unclassified Thermotoga TaxID=2631113 RepID=UPI0005437CCB|nr:MULTISPECIES: iron-containing alcohol dehydrogenase [unclassified Thermotoga]KAF2959706.1 butanol dehydrogenase [Thermotoga sp. 38H-to]KHC90734.1 iron-containing alcohol dehydrogenase [Thermotoga sp. Mc24]
MENFVFHNPTKIVFGRGTIPKIGEEIKSAGIRKILFLYGGGSIKRNGVYDQVVDSLKKHGIEWIEVSGVKPNPVLSKVYEAVEVAKREKVEAVLGVGGGSVVDSAKAVAAGALYEGDIWDAFIGEYQIERALPVFDVLTISATGTEMNGNAVITNEKTKEKYGVSSKALYPKVSIIDPSVQFTLPKEQTVYGAVDAISHILEYYFDGSSPEISNEIAEGTIRTIMKMTERLIEKPDDYEARANLAWSATIALNGTMAVGRRGGEWACHRIEHSLSALYDIAHGAGLAIVFPAWMKYVYRENPAQFERFARKIFGLEGEGEELILKGIEAFKNWLKKVGAPVSLRDAGIPEEDIDKIVDNVMLLVEKNLKPKGASLGRIMVLEREDVREILKLAAK